MFETLSMYLFKVIVHYRVSLIIFSKPAQNIIKTF